MVTITTPNPDKALTTRVELGVALPGQALQTVVLDYRRAAYWVNTATLLVSDLHWGKAETFQQFGIPVSTTVLNADLQRLTDLIAQYQPRRLLILGDLIHGRMGLTETVITTISTWRTRNPLPIQLVEGNHDKTIQTVAAIWDIELCSEHMEETPFLFSHQPIEEPPCFNWCGHLHPVIKLESAHDSLRLPCFHLTLTHGYLPAFSAFTGGYLIKRQHNDWVFGIGPEFLVKA